MLNKFYLGVLSVSLVMMAFFSYYAWSWLQSIGLPASAMDGYQYHSSIGWYVLWITFASLFLLGNAVFWKSERSWAIWTSLVYFSLFILLRYFWLEEAAFRFKKTSGLGDGSFSLGPILGAILIAGMAVFTFLDYFVLIRLYRKVFPAPIEDRPGQESESIEPQPN
jgi:hypothetical protein